MDDDYYDGLQRVNPGYGKPKFSKIEIRDILISILVLALAFTILYRNSSLPLYFEVTFGQSMGYIVLFLFCLVLVVVSFLFHEFGHKFMAQKFGLWSEYRMWPAGLGITLVTSVLGFLFASPGAVVIMGNMDKEMNGKVSIAGPIVNIVLCVIGMVVFCLTTDTLTYIFFFMLANINAILALFNLIPIPPLDGSKIFAWNKVIWGIAIAIAAAEFILLRYVI